MRNRVLPLAIAFMFFGMALANAHTSLVSSTPAKDAVLTEFPSEIKLTFNESLLEIGSDNPNKVEVTNSMGDLLSGATTVAGPVITAPLQITGNDVYKVMYRVVSQDGHVIEGDYSFTVESEIATAVPISAPIEDQVAEETGPSLLVRAAMTLAVGLAFLAMLRVKKRKK